VKVRTQQLMTPAEVAHLLNVSEATLEKWRRAGAGPTWTKLGEGRTSPVRYDPDSVRAYMGSCSK